jgi:hypothetical protein
MTNNPITTVLPNYKAEPSRASMQAPKPGQFPGSVATKPNVPAPRTKLVGDQLERKKSPSDPAKLDAQAAWLAQNAATPPKGQQSKTSKLFGRFHRG